MKRTMTSIAAAALTLAACAADRPLLQAQNPPPPQPPVQPAPTNPGVSQAPNAGALTGTIRPRRASQLVGSPAQINGGIAIGTVKDLIFDDEGTIIYVVVDKNGNQVLVPWTASKWDPARRALTVNITQERYQQVPTVGEGVWPTIYEPAFVNRIYGYYGLPAPPRRPHILMRDPG